MNSITEKKKYVSEGSLSEELFLLLKQGLG